MQVASNIETEPRAAQVLGPGGALEARMHGYEWRPSQLEMATAVERALESESVLLVEAGTGTGKTLAYLVPALLSGKKIVVSTGTKTLQDQIMSHDLPLVAELLGRDVRAAAMKGLSNYLCLRRFDEFRSSAESFSPRFARHLPLLERFRHETVSGDRAELADADDELPIWSQVSSSPETRLGAKCRFFEECFVTRMRREAEEAELVVVNHHLFFADLAMRDGHGAAVLPDYDAVIFDEAHQLEDIATEFFGVQLSMTRIEVLIRDADRVLRREADAATIDEAVVRMVASSASDVFGALASKITSEGRVAMGPEWREGALLEPLSRLDAALEALSHHAKRLARGSEGIGNIVRRAEKTRGDLQTILTADSESQIAWASARGRRVSLGASPVDVSDIFRDRLFHRRGGVVLTSATLSTGGSLRFVRERLGIDFDADELMLPSSFDYAKQAVLYLPSALPEPRDATFAGRAADEVVRLVELTGGGAFVLCTSKRAMLELHGRCAPRLELPTLLQTQGPKHAVLERFRSEENAVLFATSSFWEGVDVKGQSLRLVIIDKLPFEVPSDPLIVARCDRLRSQGFEPFMRYLVPSAALSLKQGFGRLIRSESDHGIVAILDRRLTTKGYGKTLLRSLPPARRAATYDDVAFAWREMSR